MNIEALKVSIMNYITHFSMYDYVAYAWLILLFFITILLATVLSKKVPILSLLLLIISLSLLFIGPFVLKHYLDKTLRPVQLQTTQIQKLNFSDTLIVAGDITNLSKRKLSICTIHVEVVKKGKNSLQNFLNKLKPIRKKSILLKDSLDTNSTQDFKVVFDNFRYQKKFDVSIGSSCY